MELLLVMVLVELLLLREVVAGLLLVPGGVGALMVGTVGARRGVGAAAPALLLLTFKLKFARGAVVVTWGCAAAGAVACGACGAWRWTRRC